MIKSVGIDFHQGKHIVRCLDEKAQLCDSFSFETTAEGLAILEARIFKDGANPVIVFEPAGLSWGGLQERPPRCSHSCQDAFY